MKRVGLYYLTCLILAPLLIIGLGKTFHSFSKRLVTDARYQKTSSVSGLLYENSPNLIFTHPIYKTTSTTNAEGHRGSEETPLKENVILFVGDSLIWGSAVEDDQTLPALCLNQLEEKGDSFSMINLGVGSYNLWNYRAVLRPEIFQSYHPKIVVLGISPNDHINDAKKIADAWKKYLRHKIVLSCPALKMKSPRLKL